MIEVTLGAATVGRVRLAASPAFDTIAWLGLCSEGRADPVFGSPDATARQALTDADVAMLAAVLPAGGHGYLPDFLTPKPGTDVQVLQRQLDEVAAADPADVHRQVAIECFGARPMPRDVARSVSDGSFARRAARAIAVFWRAGLAESWSRLGQLLATDIALRSQTVSRCGVSAMLGQLHPRIECEGQTLRVHIPWHEHHRYDDVELVVSPSLFGSPAVSAQLCRPDQAVLRYPATATGAARTQPAPEAVAALIGRHPRRAARRSRRPALDPDAERATAVWPPRRCPTISASCSTAGWWPGCGRATP